MGLPHLTADLLLLHAPAVFEFRNRRDIYFPFLGTSGDVPITPLYEYFPVGFKSLQRYLGDKGHDVKIVNLSSLLLRYPQIDLKTLLDALNVRIVGIDLHWMVHVQGSLQVAANLKQQRPDIKILFGGISSTYYATELIGYDFIDMVMQGYDTLEPMHVLLQRLKQGLSYEDVPNLLWKDRTGLRSNGMGYLPNTFSCGINWAAQTDRPKGLKGLPILELLSTQNAGCSYNCGWCGGSRDAFGRIYKRHRAMARKPLNEIEFELNTLQGVPDVKHYHFYSVGSYNEDRRGMSYFLDLVGKTDLKSVSYEQFHLTPNELLQEMVRASRNTVITLSPESHDPRVARLSGRGVYTNQEMEDWIERALDYGIKHIDVWYFVGMPEQTKRSVFETIDYCEHLLRKFKGQRVNPMICPMIPFLDPASTFFEHPADHGYRVFFKGAEEHRLGMQNASIINRVNYETKDLSRQEIVFTGYEAVRRLMQAKEEYGFLPDVIVSDYVKNIDEAVTFIPTVHEADCIPDKEARRRALDSLGDIIREKNEKVLYHGVANQAFPANREIGGRWFDEFGWSVGDLDGIRPAGGASGV